MTVSLLSAPFPFVASKSFSSLSKSAVRAVMTRKQNQLLSASDRATPSSKASTWPWTT